MIKPWMNICKPGALVLIELEEDAKYRSKYMGLWKDLLKEKKGKYAKS